MTTFYICRHGQTENNQQERFQGWIDTPLTKLGEHNAKAAAAKLRGLTFDCIVSSDLGRAFTTAYIITRELGTSLEIKREKELREVNYGEYANQPYSIYPPDLSPEENAWHVAPKGESLVQMQQRVMAYTVRLAAESPGRSVLVVAHDGTINAIRASFLHQNVGIADLTKNAHDFVGKFSVEGGKIISFEAFLTE